jgi:preprotein translocase subunit SecE
MAEAVSKGAPIDDGKPMAQQVQALPARVKEYVEDLKAEMRRVTWPSRAQVQTTTLVVILTVFVFAAYFWGVDLILGRGVARIFETLAQK